MASVRAATIADLDALAPLFDAYRVFYRKPSDVDAARAFLAARLERAESAIFLAEDDGDAIGFTQLYPGFSSCRMARILILNDLYVDTTARGRGVGRMLLDAAVDHARGTRAAFLTLATETGNTGARALYERAGWVWSDGFRTYNFTIEAPR